MTQATTITVDDGQATPVSHTLTPVSVSGNTVRWEDKSALTILGRLKLVLGLSPASSKRNTVRVTQSIAMPVEVTDGDGVTTVTDVARKDATYIIPASFTASQRADFYAYCKNIESDNRIKEYIEDADPAY